MKRLLCLSFVLFLAPACGDTADSDRSGTDGSLTNLDTGTQDDLNGLDFGAADRGSPDQGSTEDAETDSTSSADDTAQDEGSSNIGSVFISSGDVYSPGPLSVTRRRVTASASSAPYDLDLYEPDGTGTYPVVIFHHGFILSIDAYVDMLEHLASHGFVVVCPQLYGPSMIPIGQPSTTDEVGFARELRAWVLDGLASETSANIRTDLLGYAGHSRGAKVAWMLPDQILQGPRHRGC